MPQYRNRYEYQLDASPSRAILYAKDEVVDFAGFFICGWNERLNSDWGDRNGESAVGNA
jgi:hypothetical protein